MAKRLKLSADDLSNAPEVKELRKLDKGMSKTIRSNEDNKLQKYEELLAEYKQLLESFSRAKSRELDVDKEDIKDRITAVLSGQGVSFKDAKVHFPLLDNNERKRRRRRVAEYSRKSVDKAVDFLTAKEHRTADTNTRRMAGRIYEYLKGQVNVDHYPNSKLYSENAAVFTGKWNRL
jgi:alanyl-tRNA synthetase